MVGENKVYLRGIVARDAALKETRRGQVCEFTLAVPEGDEETEIVAALFGMTARTWRPLLTAGKAVRVVGRLGQTTRQVGERVYTNLRLVVEDVGFIEADESGDTEEFDDLTDELAEIGL
jgi:single-stranded DNA-binding protein